MQLHKQQLKKSCYFTHLNKLIMSKEQKESNKENESKKDNQKKGDPETLNTTDPQEHMEGPISSLMHKTAKSFPKEQTQDEAEKKETNK